MRFTLYIDTDRAPDGPTTWDHLIGMARNELDRLEDHAKLTGMTEVRPLRFGVTSYDGYFTIGLVKVEERK